MRLIIISFLLIACIGCNKKVFKEKWTREQAPSTFVTRFETSKGTFDIKVNREWAPIAADRFYQLVKHKHFDSGIFYRVVPNFVAQFGSSDTVQFKTWKTIKMKDEKVVQGNKKGTITFARRGKENRTTEVFINLVDNPRLDTLNYEGVIGYPPFGEVINGMDVVSRLFSGYGDKTLSDLRAMYVNKPWFLTTYPQLDFIRKVYFIK